MKALRSGFFAACFLLAFCGLAHAPALDAPDFRDEPRFDNTGFPATLPVEQRQTLATLFAEVRNANTDPAKLKSDIDTALKLYGVPTVFFRILLGAAKGDTEQVPLGPDTPNILIKRPVNPAYRPIVDLLTKQFQSYISAVSVDRDDLTLLPLVYSSDGKAKLENEIPRVRRARGKYLENVVDGTFDTLDAWMFTSFRGKEVVIIGHVVNANGKPAFEIKRSDGGVRYLSFDQLSTAANAVGFNYIPLGCETADIAPIGTATKITDLDALDSFKNAMQKSGKSTFGQLLTDLSSPQIRFQTSLINQPYRNAIPVDLIDQQNQVLRAYPSGAPAGSVPLPQPLFWIDLPSASAGSLVGAASPTILARSIRFAALRPAIEQWWFLIFYAMMGLAAGAALLELPFRHALSLEYRSRAAAFVPPCCAALAFGLRWCFQGWLDTNLGDVGGIVLGASIGWVTLLPMRKDFPDHRAAIGASLVVVIWIQAPLVAKVLLYGAEKMDYLVEPAPM